MYPTRHRGLPFATILIAAAVIASASTTQAVAQTTDVGPEIEISPATDVAHPPADLAGNLGDFCFFADLPPISQKYRAIKKLKVGKGSYGGVKDILPKMAEKARMYGADAIIEYRGSQRFGFWPWRMVRPVVRGVAVQWTEPRSVDCESIGGTKLSTILSSNQPPAQ